MQAKLIIKDEVNVKIEGLELSTRKKLVDKFKYEIPGARLFAGGTFRSLGR